MRPVACIVRSDSSSIDTARGSATVARLRSIEDDTDAGLPKQIGNGQTCRSGAENCDVELIIGHFRFPFYVQNGSMARFRVSCAPRPQDPAFCIKLLYAQRYWTAL
jgi:hypothetical protein